jgi:hypothetical protein
MKTTIAEFIAPYIETKVSECLIGATLSSREKFQFTIGLLETRDIEFDENGFVSTEYGRRILELTEKCATISYWYGDTEDVRLTDEHTIYIEQWEHEKLLCSLDLKTMEVTNY